jgi:uncharacterized coiled-coil protein SlyX
MVEKAVNNMEFSGVNLITGPSNAGKTLLCEAIRWALTGATGLHHPGAVSLIFDSVKIERREGPKGGSEALVTVDGATAADPETALLGMGVIPAVYTHGVTGLFSSNYPDLEPPSMVELDKERVDLNKYSIEKCEATLRDLFAEREGLKIVAAGIESKTSTLQTEVDALSREIMELKKQEQAQLDLCALHVMNSGECPVYPVTCVCTDPIVELTKEHFRKRTEGVERIADFSLILREKERALAARRFTLEILCAGLPDAKGKNLQARLAEVEARVALGEKVVEGVTKLAAWKRIFKEREPFVKISDKLAALASEFGLPLAFNGRSYLLRGGPVEQASRTDLILLGYCLQDAAGVPVLVVDDFDVLDKNWKSRLISRATATGKPILLFASSSGPVRIPGVASWHLNGRLEKVA